MADAQALLAEARRLQEAGALDAAVAIYRRVVAEIPEHVLAWGDLGYALLQSDDLAGAVAGFRAALTRNPYYGPAYTGLGVALTRAGQPAAAMAALERAVALQPGDPIARYNRADVALLSGQLARGWVDFEARLATGSQPRSRFLDVAPLWDGRALAPGQRLLVHAEQGYGDTLQFCRYVHLLTARGIEVVFAVQPLLLAFLAGQFACTVVSETQKVPPVDWQIPLMSLPRVFATTLACIPADIPYLHPDPPRVAAWRDRLAALPQIKVGLVWSGEPRPEHAAQTRMDRRRSLQLSQLAPLADLAGIAFVSLQLGPARAQAACPPAGMALHDWTADIHDFRDTAALLAALDLTISVDTAVAHLAGALGRPVWLLNRFDTCWRWLLGRDDSPWYPTLRQFRQPAPGDWASAVRAVRVALEATDITAPRRPRARAVPAAG